MNSEWLKIEAFKNKLMQLLEEFDVRLEAENHLSEDNSSDIRISAVIKVVGGNRTVDLGRVIKPLVPTESAKPYFPEEWWER